MVPDEHVVTKLLGRCGCDACGKSFNSASVHDEQNGVFMPPILPANVSAGGSAAAQQQSGVWGEMHCDCGALLSKRADDTEEVIAERLEVYHAETAPLIEHYRQRGLLAEYRVRYGLGDMDRLVAELQSVCGGDLD